LAAPPFHWQADAAKLDEVREKAAKIAAGRK
jgi:hypothetical protein